MLRSAMRLMVVCTNCCRRAAWSFFRATRRLHFLIGSHFFANPGAASLDMASLPRIVCLRPQRKATRARTAMSNAQTSTPGAAYAILFEPVAIGPLVTKNRFFQMPHYNGMGYRDPSAEAAMRKIKA